MPFIQSRKGHKTMGKDSFILYDNYDEQISTLTDEQAGVLVKAIFAYRNGKELPKMDGYVSMAFSFIRAQLAREQEKYDGICEKRRAAGAMGGAPKNNQNASKQPKQANATKCDQNNQMQAKQADNDNDNDNDNEYEYDNNKKKSTNVLKEKESTDGRTDERQKLFFDKYPLIVIDNYSTADYVDMDFELLLFEFERSKFLQGRRSFKWICANYRAIIAGQYRNFDEEHNAPKKKPLYAPPKVYSCEPPPCEV